MSTIEIITLCNTILTTVTLTVTYFNYHHSRKKDFQDKLFQIKLDAYKDLNAKCYDAYLTLNINSEPFNEIYKIDTKEEWDKYFDKEFRGLYKVGFEMQESIYGYAYLLPNDVIEKYYDFSNFCLSFVTMSAHFDTGLIVDNTDRIWAYYTELINLIRHDLKIEVIDKGLLKGSPILFFNLLIPFHRIYGIQKKPPLYTTVLFEKILSERRWKNNRPL